MIGVKGWWWSKCGRGVKRWWDLGVVGIKEWWVYTVVGGLGVVEIQGVQGDMDQGVVGSRIVGAL